VTSWTDRSNLAVRGFDTLVSFDGSKRDAARRRGDRHVLLDRMLPEVDGFDAVQADPREVQRAILSVVSERGASG